MGDKKKADRRKQKDLTQQSISIERFLSNILGVKVEELLRAHLTHEDLKEMFPKLKRESIAKVLDDPSLLTAGKVVYVTDSLNRTIPYKTERERFTDIEFQSDFDRVMDPVEWKKPACDVPRIKYEDLSSFSTYELCELAKKLFELGYVGDRTRVLKELKTRDDSKQGVRRSKEKALKKERKYLKKLDDEDDDY